MLKIVLVYENSAGLRHDVRIVRHAIERATLAAVEFFDVCLDWSQSSHEASAANDILNKIGNIDGVIFFEITNNHPKLLAAPWKALLPNPEYLEDRYIATAKKCSVIWHKSEYSKRQLEKVLPKARHVFVGFTSDPPNITAIQNNNFLHIKGAGGTKRNTSKVLNVWLQNPDFPSLTILSHEQLCKYPEKLPNNVSIIHGWLDQWKYNDYYQRNGIHLCTSECEGFRHYINEARASGALVITTGAPPMDELITTRSGLLIKAASKSQFNHGFVYSTTESEIYSAVKAALALPPDERGRMIELSQSTFWKDRSRFFSRMENEFNQNLRLNSLRRSMWLKFLMGRN